ncbi:MAG: CHASE domain-containing protein [Planctomycetales bacterium]|nr:CHASE domain-containing protein [Planctomycetales bacterium]
MNARKTADYEENPNRNSSAPTTWPSLWLSFSGVETGFHWIHWLIVVFSLAMTFVAWDYSRSERDARVEAQFEREAEHVVELARERMQKYEDALWGGVAFAKTTPAILDFELWKAYAESIDIAGKYPGINGLGFIDTLSQQEVDGYLQFQRELRPDFSIHPAHERQDLFPISYIIPVEGNEKAVGLDIAYEENRHAAALQARDTGLAQVTGPIALVQDQAHTPGFLFYAPIFKDDLHGSAEQVASLEDRRRTFAGLVYAPFVVQKLMEGALEKGNRQVGIRLLDGQSVLYDEHNVSEPDYDPSPLLVQSFDVDMYGRKWTFDVRSTNSFRAATADSQPLVILFGGLLIDALVVFIFVVMSRSSAKAMRLARSMTAELKQNYGKLRSEVEQRQQAEQSLKQLNASLNESQTKLRGLFEQSSNFIGVTTTDGILLDANATALKAAGISKDEVLGRPFWETIWWTHSPDLQQRLKDAIGRAAGGESDRFQATHPAADGTDLQVDVSVSPVRDEQGKIVFLVPEGRDISPLKKQERELQELLEVLKTSNHELEQFAYVASHDLQEPLRKISAYAQLLREDYGQHFDATADSYLDVVIDGAKRLKDLINDLLTFSRITTRGSPLGTADLNQAFCEAVSQLELAICESQAEITHDPLPTVLADQGQLSLVFQNLIGNSIKYSTAKPRVHVGVRDLDNQIQVSVRDNGIGIEPKFHQRIFEIFQRLHNRREYSGTGIGLAITKRIIERCGGEIRVESELGQGSTFIFTLHKPDEGTESRRSVTQVVADSLV